MDMKETKKDMVRYFILSLLCLGLLWVTGLMFDSGKFFLQVMGIVPFLISFFSFWLCAFIAIGSFFSLKEKKKEAKEIGRQYDQWLSEPESSHKEGS